MRRPGIVWYLTANESHNNDGRHTHYDSLRGCDEQLFDALRPVARRGSRTVKALTESVQHLLPPGTIYHADRLGPETDRALWLERASGAVQKCDLLFLDPDNGLEVPSVPQRSKKACKYVFYRDLEILDPRRLKSFIIYQHVGRHGTAEEQARARLETLKGVEREGWALRFRRFSPRFFLVLPDPTHWNKLWARTQGFLDGLWGQPDGHRPAAFELVPGPQTR